MSSDQQSEDFGAEMYGSKREAVFASFGIHLLNCIWDCARQQEFYTVIQAKFCQSSEISC